MKRGGGKQVTSMRSSLLRSVAGIITALVVAVVAAAFVDDYLLVRALSRALIGQAIGRAERDVEQFLEPVERAVVVGSELVRDGQFPLDDLVDAEGRPTEQFLVFNDRLSAMLTFIPQASSLILVDDAGHEFMLLKQPDGWFNRLTRPGVAGIYFRWTEQSPMPTRTPELDRPEYDYRQRPWFKDGLNAPMMRFGLEFSGQRALLEWTLPYRFYTTGELGITAVGRTEDPEGNTRIFAIDVLLEDLSLFTMNNRIRSSGMVAIMAESMLGEAGVVEDWVYTVGLPAGIREVAGENWERLLGHPPESLGMPVLVDAVEAFQTAVSTETRQELLGRPREQVASERTFLQAIPFESQGQTWWSAMRVVPLGGSDRLWIAGLVPESDLVFGADRVDWGLAIALLIILGLAGRHAVSLAQHFSAPLETLAAENQRIARGDLDPGETVQSRVREIQSLVEAQDRMRAGLKSLMKLEGDLQLARQIQQRTLPESIPDVKGFEICGWSEPAEETAGDTWDVIERDDGRIWLILADATGHGVGPALSVVQARAMIRAISSLGTSLPEAVQRVNQQLCADLPPGRFVTLWFGELDPESRTLKTFSAGQAPLFHYRVASDEFEKVEADTYPLGIDPSPIEQEARNIHLEKGDMFIVISDGVFEADAPGGEQMGTDRVLDVLRRERSGDLDTVLAALRAAVEAFSNGQPARDDQTVVLLRAR